MRKLDQYIGTEHNSWTILGVERGKHPSGKYYSKFKCVCKCGTKQLCQPTDVLQNRSTQCLDCKYKESQDRYVRLEGKTFSKWTVIKLHARRNIKDDGYRKLIWECRCECGRIGYVQSSNLTQNLSKSCGLCEPSKQLADRLLKKLYHGLGKRRYNVDESIDGDYLINLLKEQNERCAISGVPIYFSTSWHKHGTASLDRRDNNLGYIKGNIQWVHKDVNKMKHAFNQDYFIQTCKLIAENNK